MGHLEIGGFSTAPRWQRVLGLLTASDVDAPAVAAATCLASERRLRRLSADPSLAHCFWLLTRLAAAARGDAFLEEVARLGVPARADDTALRFVARVADRTRVDLNRFPQSGPFGEMAAVALRRALAETVGVHGRSLAGSALEDLELAFRRHSTAGQFADLAGRFFGSFMAQVLRYYVDRGLPAGAGGGLASPRDGAEFLAALDLHARQLGRVVERFAMGWYAKKNWETLGHIGEDDARGFVAHAMPKLRGALVRGVRP